MLVVKMLTDTVLCMDGAGKCGVNLFITITTCISRVSLMCLGRERPRVSVPESSAAHAQGPFHQVSGHLLSTLSSSSSPAAVGFNIPDKWLTSFFLRWDEVPGQKEKVCAGDTDVWQLCSKSSSHLLSRQRSAWRCCPKFLPCFPLKLLALRGARLTLAPGVLLALLLQVAGT